MNLTVEIPDEIASRLTTNGGDLSRQALEGLAANAYRHERLTKHELQSLLGIQTGDLEIFFKDHDLLSGHSGEYRGTGGTFDADRARVAGARIRAMHKGVTLDRQGMSIRDLAHLGHKY
jgi:hypothetical protein